MNILQDIDNFIFQVINVVLSNDFFDYVIPWFRNKYFWIPLYIFLIAHCVINYGKHAYIIIVTAILTISIADQLSASLLKPLVQRERPCNNIELNDINTLAPCRQSFSFPSSHATNHFSLAVFFTLVFGFWKRKWKFLLIMWAGLVCFAQIYVGLHYFTDVLIGAVLGIFIARLTFYFLNKYYLRQFLRVK